MPSILRPYLVGRAKKGSRARIFAGQVFTDPVLGRLNSFDIARLDSLHTLGLRSYLLALLVDYLCVCTLSIDQHWFQPPPILRAFSAFLNRSHGPKL